MERGQRLALQIRKAIDPTAADPVVLDVLPHPLTRVELRGVARQEAQAQPTLGRRGELLDGARAVHRMAVDDAKHRPRRVGKQPAAEADEHRRVQVAVVGGKPQRALGGDPESRLTATRSPVLRTTGVCPTGAQVVPAW